MRLRTVLCRSYIITLLTVVAVFFLSPYIYAQKPTAKTFFEIGVKKSENAEYSEALDAFKQAIKLKPDYAEAYYNLGHIYFNLHRYTEAADAYKAAVKAKPAYVEAYISLGIVSSMLSRYDEAIEALKKAVKINPKSAEAFYNLGNIYSEFDKTEEAVEAFRQAVKIKPDFAEAHYNLGVACLSLKEKDLKSAKEEYYILEKLDKERAKELNDLITKAAKGQN
jgi:tetratricopeptide (TPR) repeat protein